MNKKPSVAETEQGSSVGREQDILVSRMCMIQEWRSGQVLPGQENEQEQDLENSLSVSGRRKPASGGKAGKIDLARIARQLGIYSVGEGFFYWGPQPF